MVIFHFATNSRRLELAGSWPLGHAPDAKLLDVHRSWLPMIGTGLGRRISWAGAPRGSPRWSLVMWENPVGESKSQNKRNIQTHHISFLSHNFGQCKLLQYSTYHSPHVRSFRFPTLMKNPSGGFLSQPSNIPLGSLGFPWIPLGSLAPRSSEKDQSYSPALVWWSLTWPESMDPKWWGWKIVCRRLDFFHVRWTINIHPTFFFHINCHSSHILNILNIPSGILT